jgi:hypothetical protein
VSPRGPASPPIRPMTRCLRWAKPGQNAYRQRAVGHSREPISQFSVQEQIGAPSTSSASSLRWHTRSVVAGSRRSDGWPARRRCRDLPTITRCHARDHGTPVAIHWRHASARRAAAGTDSKSGASRTGSSSFVSQACTDASICVPHLSKSQRRKPPRSESKHGQAWSVFNWYSVG